jgi:hypothetical protein
MMARAGSQRVRRRDVPAEHAERRQGSKSEAGLGEQVAAGKR